MNKAVPENSKWTERPSAPGEDSAHHEAMFQLLFERSPDAIWLMDPRELVFVDCNDAAVKLLRAKDRAQLVGVHPAEVSPAVQPDGQDSRAKAAQLNALTEAQGTQRFEWIARRFDGTEVPLEVATIPIATRGRRLNVVVARDITERKLAEDALRESERKFRQLFEASSDRMLILDAETLSCLDCNAAAAAGAIGGKQWLIGRSIFDLAPERQADGRLTRDAARDWVGRALREGPQRFEWTGKRQDGTDIPLEVLLTPIRCCEDRTFLVSAARDISERKRAEQEIRDLNQNLERRIAERTAELAASEARFRALVEHAPEAIIVFEGETGRFLFGNEHTCRLFGVTPEELSRLTPAEVSPEFQAGGRRSCELAREKMEEALAGGTPVFEWVHQHTSGRLVPTEVRLVRLHSDGRQLLRASIIDNTERKRREAIQQATFQISEAAHTADDLSSFYARVHRIVQTLMPANNFYLALYQPETSTVAFPYFVDETEGPPRPFPLGTGLTGYVLRTGKPLLVGEELNARKRRIGKEVTFEGLPEIRYVESGKPAAIWLGVPLSLGGMPLGVMAVQDYHNARAYGDEEIRILTFVAEQTALALERKRAETELRKTLAREKELGQLKSNFVSMVSHEFRTPLGIIQSSAEILSDYFDRLQPAERGEQLASIVKNTRRMAEMMEEILVLSRLDAGKMDFKPAPLDLGDFCRRIVDEVMSATERRCPVELSLPAVGGEIQADERLLSHIFTNLLGNAVKYSQPGQPVRFMVEQQADQLVCRIRDEGIGIPEADQKWLFRAFHRGSNVRERAGTGLGLVLVKRCLELHSGQLNVESRVGLGTTMTVCLPLIGAIA